jgi:hypothetical protein
MPADIPLYNLVEYRSLSCQQIRKIPASGDFLIFTSRSLVDNEQDKARCTTDGSQRLRLQL